MRTILIILGLVCLALAVLYWMVPADQLPSFIPGFDASLARKRNTHGIAAAVAGVVLLAIGWFAGRRRV